MNSRRAAECYACASLQFIFYFHRCRTNVVVARATGARENSAAPIYNMKIPTEILQSSVSSFHVCTSHQFDDGPALKTDSTKNIANFSEKKKKVIKKMK